MKNLFYIIITLILLSCVSSKEKTQHQVIKGDLYYKFLNLVNFYNVHDSIYQKFQLHLDTVGMEGLKKEDGEDVSSIEIKNILEQLISEENKKKPLTDNILSIKMKEKGYVVARRTVAKYREQLEIPVARLRKEL